MKRRKFTSEFKTKVVLESLKGLQTSQELAQKFELHPQQISSWKREFLEKASGIFEDSKGSKKDKKSETEQERDELLRTIGELKVENDFLKKRLR